MADRSKKPEHDDAWWAAQRHAYIEKNDILLSDHPSWEWVSPYDFWRTIFPEGFLQPRGEEVPWHERGGGTSRLLEQKGNALPFYLRKRGRADSVPLSVLRDLGSLRACGLAARGGACMRGQAPSNSPKGSGSWFGTPLRGGRRKPRAAASPNQPSSRLGQGKGR